MHLFTLSTEKHRLILTVFHSFHIINAIKLGRITSGLYQQNRIQYPTVLVIIMIIPSGLTWPVKAG